MTETAEASDGVSGLNVLFGALAVVGAVLMYVGEGIVGTEGEAIAGLSGQAVSAIGLTVVLTAGTILVVLIHLAEQ
jgi:hypothetical protein